MSRSMNNSHETNSEQVRNTFGTTHLKRINERFLKECIGDNKTRKGETVETDASIDSAYIPSEDVVARDLDGELIIVPLTSGIGDMEDEIYTLNETGRAIWEKLDGKRSLREVAETLKSEFEARPGEIEDDTVGLVGSSSRGRW